MKLDRDLQREILKTLEKTYPASMGHADWERLVLEYGDEQFRANCLYLDAHGLLTWDHGMGGVSVYITHKGLDFLADDGGLSAILGVVTIRLHDDQIRLLLEARIQGSDAPEEEKRKWLDQLRGIPADATKHLVHKLIDAGLAQWPTVLSAMQTLAT
ncbi:hypothetical protein ABRZ00_12865 [Castellaniella ginsengisoli]|uniref:Uncharacterized protein n=1 Tax=Castellaniella ginsengisoli TaxID=546114 RepID=A0AB39DKL4_9BURK